MDRIIWTKLYAVSQKPINTVTLRATLTLIVTVGVGGTGGSILTIPEASLLRPMSSAFNETDCKRKKENS